MNQLKSITDHRHLETAKTEEDDGEYDEGETYLDVPPPPPLFPKDNYSLKSDETNDSKKSPINTSIVGDSMGNETLEIMRAANAVLGDSYCHECPSASCHNRIMNDEDEANKRDFQFTDINNEWNEDSFFQYPLIGQDNRNNSSQIVFETEKSSQVDSNDSNTNHFFPTFDDLQVHTDSGDILKKNSVSEHADMTISQNIPKCCSLVSQHVVNSPSHEITPNQSSPNSKDISDDRFEKMLILDPHNRAEALRELDTEDKQELRNRLNYNECGWSISPRSDSSGYESTYKGKIHNELCENTTGNNTTTKNKERLVSSESELVAIPENKFNKNNENIGINNDIKLGMGNQDVDVTVKNTKEQKANVQKVIHDVSNECDENKNLKKKPFLKRGSRKEPSSLNRLSLDQHNKTHNKSQHSDRTQTQKERLQELEDIQQKHIQQLEVRLKKRELARKCIKQNKNKKLNYRHDETNANRKEANPNVITKSTNVGKTNMTRKMKDIPNQSQLVDIQNIHDSGCDEIWDSDAMNEQNFSPSSTHMSLQSYEQYTIPERPPESKSNEFDLQSL